MAATKHRARGHRARPTSRSSKVGLKFPVARIQRMLREGQYAKRISSGAPVFLAAVLEYLTSEVIDCAGVLAKAEKKNRINPRHILLALRTDLELNMISKGVTVHQGGNLPNIQEALFPGNHPRKAKKGQEQDKDQPKPYSSEKAIQPSKKTLMAMRKMG